ncbi:MAG TPA: serine hydrolase domain-containing protein [Acidimicrobiales bacterium]|nr:serine hydrolase domain-containing protein [Acidimicrobiales bacterium]
MPDPVSALLDRARREVDEGILPACQLAVAQHGEIVVEAAFGDATTDDRFLIFSATKPVVAAAVWQLLAEGKLDVTQKVADLIPEFATNGKDVVTVEQVLLHTSGFPYAPLGPPRWAEREHRLERMAGWRLTWEPGSRFEYHATSAHWVLAEIIERLDGDDYRAAIQRRVVEPLGLERFRLGIPPGEQGDVKRVVRTGEPPTAEEIEAATGMKGVTPEVLAGGLTDDLFVMLSEPDNVAVGVPGAGGVSTAADVARFYQGLLANPGGLWDPAILADATGNIRNSFPDPMLGHAANRTLGLVMAGEDGKASMRGMGRTVSPGTFGHNGAGGQIAWADPATGLSFCYLTNGIDAHLIRQWRRGPGLSNRAAACAR